MEHLRLATAFPIGRILDALEQLPEMFFTPHRPSPAQRVAIETAHIEDEAALQKLARRAIREDSDVLIAVGARHTLGLRPAVPIPVIIVSDGTTFEAIANRLRNLESEALSPRLLAEERARSSIIDIVDRAASLLGGHIIVEDQDFQMIAYSQLSSPVDEARQDAILQRQMPTHLARVFHSQGVQASLLIVEDVVRVSPDFDVGLGPRLIVAIRHRGRLVGTIWFARANSTFSARDVRELQSAAERMSLVLAGALRLREDDQIQYDDAALDLLYGRQVDNALEVLGEQLHGFHGSAHVMSFAQVLPSPEKEPARLSDFRALAASSAPSVSSKTINVPEGNRLHVIRFGCDEPAEECAAVNARLIADQISTSLRRVNIDVAVGLGRHVDDSREIVESAQSANRVLASLLREGRAEIASAKEFWAPLLLDSFLNVPKVSDELVPAEVSILLQSKVAKDLELMRTVRDAINHWGDIAGVAKNLHVHQNTVRYRLHRFTDMTAINLADPVKRLALWMLFTHHDMVTHLDLLPRQVG